MSVSLDTGCAGVSVIFIEKGPGNFIITIEVDRNVTVNEQYQMAVTAPDIAAEMVLEHCQKTAPNYLVFGYLLGLLIPFLERKARGK